MAIGRCPTFLPNVAAMSLFDDAELGTGEPTFSVTELSDRIGNALRAAFRDEVWVRGEIRNLNRARSGHVYFTLTDPDSDGIACISVMLSDRNRSPVNRSLKQAGDAVRMSDGTEVRIRGRLDWYAPQGSLQLRMTAIDPAFTLGQLEVARAQLLARLTAEGLLEANKRCPLPLVPLRVALVTSLGSAAEADFRHELERSGFAFDLVRLDVRVQGFDAPLEIPAALGRAAELGVDVVALVRGGGARTDLAAFDDERIARAIAACPVPVLTGIGHEVDRSIADEVAHRAEKTPTACAHALVLRVRAFSEALEERWAAVARCAARAVDHESAQLERRAERASRAASVGAATAGHRLDARAERVGRAARGHLRAADGGVSERSRRLVQRAPRAVAVSERELGSREARVRALDPARTLARGWSITRTADGTVVRSPDQVRPGDELVTQVEHGPVRSTVTPASTVGTDG
jgi:exodeoxyribonuclease VII large subunit